MKLKILLFTALFIGFFTVAQTSKGAFKVGLGVNIIDNSNGSAAPWEIDSAEFKAPFYLEADYGLSNAFSLGILGSTNTLSINNQDEALYSLDMGLKYYLNWLSIKNTDVYAGLGTGFYHVADDTASTFNMNLGLTYWVSDNWGFNLSGLGKKSFDSGVAGVENYYQYNIGLVWRSKASAAPETTEELPEAMPEPLPSEVEATQAEVVNAPEVEETEVEAVVTTPVEPVVQPETSGPVLSDRLASVYFDKNSSYMSVAEKVKLDELVQFLEAHPDVNLYIEAYTDQTGTEKYNRWLSERRLNRVINYLLKARIPETRLQGEAKGVDTANQCPNIQDCSESDLQKQRRCTFEIRD